MPRTREPNWLNPTMKRLNVVNRRTVSSIVSTRIALLGAPLLRTLCALFVGLAAPEMAFSASAVADEADEARRVAAAVESTLQAHASDVHTCIARAAADRLGVGGRLELEVTVGKQHKVVGSRVVSKDESLTPDLANCVSDASLTWKVADVAPGSLIVLPFSLPALTSQFVVNESDAPNRGPKSRGRRGAPFEIRILADNANVRARTLSALMVSIAPANRVAMTRHPNSDKLIYAVGGVARILGPEGFEPIRLVPDTAVLIPKGFPHVVENMGRQLPARLLTVFVGPGPEKIFRDARDAQARKDFEVVRGAKLKLPQGPRPSFSAAKSAPEGTLGAATKTGMNRAFFQPPQDTPETNDRDKLDPEQSENAQIPMSVGLSRLNEGERLTPEADPGQAHLLFVREGQGSVSVGQQSIPISEGAAIHIPVGQPWSLAAEGGALTFVHIRAPWPRARSHAR